MRLGELLDLINCLAIYNGAEPAKRPLSFDQVIRLR